MIENISSQQKEILINSANLLSRHARVYVSVISENDHSISLSIIQRYNPNGNYADKNTLIIRAKEMFQDFTNKELVVYAEPYVN